MSSRVALARGLFAAEGLDVDLLPGDLSKAHRMGGGDWLVGPNGPVRADITTIEFQALVDMALGQLDYYVIAGEHSGCRQLIVPVNSSIQSVADLTGKRIGLPPINDRLMWDYLIRQASVAPESVRWVFTTVAPGGSEEIEFVKREFTASRLDAYVTTDPSGEILKIDGVARLLASNTWTSPLSGWYCCMIAVRHAVLDAHPEVARALTRAYRQSATLIERNPAEAVALSVKAGYMPSDTRQDLCARLLGEYVWTATGRIEEDLQRYFQLLIEAGRLPKSSSPAELVKRVYRGTEV
jgi:ABC-type nitrate/sulfonate/bicarbonate transport system substrate-binding protein